MSRAAFTAADVARMVKGALRGGLSPDQFKIVHRDGELSLLPVSASEPLSEADDLARRMREMVAR